MGFFLIMKAELVRTWIIMRRYWFRTVISMAISYGMLMGIIFALMTNPETVQQGVDTMVGDPIEATNKVLGFIIGIFAFGIVGAFSQGLQGMARTGVLEQLCMSPHGLVTNFLVRTSVSSIMMVINSAILVWLVSFSIGGHLYFHPLELLVLIPLTFINLLGFGFMVGGLVLVFKQVGQVAILLRLALMGIAWSASESLFQHGKVFSGIMHFMPITDASVCLKHVIIKNQGTVELTETGERIINPDNFVHVFAHPSFFWLVANCTFWCAIGITLFKIMENYSRSKGTLGAY